MGAFLCEKCDNPFTADELPRRGAICFKCHVRTISLGFSYGKDDFHGPTLKERQERQIAEAKSAGINPEPVGSRWV